VGTPADLLDQPMLVESAKRGDRDAFQRLAEPYRRGLQLHCYRMLVSFHDAEDLVQETLLRAWRGLGGSSTGTWLGPRLALSNRDQRLPHRPREPGPPVLPEMLGPPSDRMPEGRSATEIPWLEAYPDAALEGIADAAPGPEAPYEQREAVQLAFIAAIHHLPPRQRAVLLLRDLLGWSAAETARLLEASVASVNSASTAAARR
jgi:RNA polymerase sigma-70 factor (ECF subfamily)